ncbi:MAG: hypothetical protein ACD_79C00409G0002 [uncultured bacterium]|nr:MAG: hypothetical protein ACD_79C00409G0002 [uncultured bacterium]
MNSCKWEFVHFIDEFLKLLSETETVAPNDIVNYFGTGLSKIMLEKTKSRINSHSYFSLKPWSMALETNISGFNNELMKEPYKLTEEKLNDIEKGIIKLSDMNNIHLSWFFYGDSNEKVLSQIYKNLKSNLLKKNKYLNDILNYELHFKGLDILKKTGAENRGILFLKPQDKSVCNLLEAEYKISSLFGYKRIGNFIPHLTLARIKDIKKFTGIKETLEDVWKDCVISFKIRNIILYRNLGHIHNQKVFGLFAG